MQQSPTNSNTNAEPPGARAYSTDVAVVAYGSADQLERLSIDTSNLFIIPLQPATITVKIRQEVEPVSYIALPHTVYRLSAAHIQQVDGKEMIIIAPHGDRMTGMLGLHEDDASEPVDSWEHPDVFYFSHFFERHFRRPDCPDQPYLTLLSELVLTRYCHQRKRYENRLRVNGILSPTQLQTCFDQVETRLGEPITVTELAALVDLPLAQFSRAFKSATGVSPKRYIMQRRVYRAILLIESSDLNLAAIAHETGFSSQAHMNAAFAKHQESSPGYVLLDRVRQSK